MNQDKLGDITFCLLDYERPIEAKKCLESIKNFVKFSHQIVYVSNGGNQAYVDEFYKQGLIDTLILNKANQGCGIGTRQAIRAAMTKWVIYVQVDQFLIRPFERGELDSMIFSLERERSSAFYVDLAGNQGHGNFSERALLIERDRYLSVPSLDDTIGGPGPYANYVWTEELVQTYMKNNNLTFFGVPVLFADNGKISRRTYPCGAETIHYTDEKRLFVLKSFKKKYDDFPNLHLNEEEWKMAMTEDGWPKEGLIPEADKQKSFIYWR